MMIRNDNGFAEGIEIVAVNVKPQGLVNVLQEC